MGPVGSGKSTQAQLLADYLHLPHLEMGDLLRRLSEANEQVKAVVQSGQLVPDDLTLKLLGEELVKEEYTKGFVIDGVPRTLYQAQNLPFTPDLVVYLRVRDSENIKRLLLRKRGDDTEEIITGRLKIYHDQTAPVLDFYRAQNKLLEIDGEPTIEIIAQDILAQLRQLQLIS